jgi:hypothetical protein
MEAAVIVIIGFMGPLIVLCIVGIFVVHNLNKKGQ